MVERNERDRSDPETMSREERRRRAGAPVDLELIHSRALLAAMTAVNMKGEDVKVIDAHELTSYTDYLVLCTGRNSRLTRRIAEEIASKLKGEAGLKPAGSEGIAGAEWILIDFLDFVIHVFTPEAREFYRLDVLWKEAPVETVE